MEASLREHLGSVFEDPLESSIPAHALGAAVDHVAGGGLVQPDLAVFGPDDGVPMVLVMTAFSDGRLIISTNLGFIVLDPDTGEVLDNRALGGMGWAAFTPAVYNEHVIVGNFFSGDVIKYSLASGEVVARANIGQKNSLSGVVQFPGL